MPKITELTESTTLHGDEDVPIVDGGVTKRVKAYRFSPPVTPQGRLTIQSGYPVSSWNQVQGNSTVYYAPYVGRWVPIWDGSRWVNTDIGGELSQATTDASKSPAACASNSVYDIFVWNDAGTIRATRGPVWTNNTTRACGLTRTAGIWTNAAAITNGPAQYRGTYVGTIRTNSTATVDWVTEGRYSTSTPCTIGVWNIYNRVDTAARYLDNGVYWEYNTPSIWRKWRGDEKSYHPVMAVWGLNEDSIDLNCSSGCYGIYQAIGIGFNSETVPTWQGEYDFSNQAPVATYRTLHVSTSAVQSGASLTAAGAHYFTPMEACFNPVYDSPKNRFNLYSLGELVIKMRA